MVSESSSLSWSTWSFKAVHLSDASLPPQNKICVTFAAGGGEVPVNHEVLLQPLLVEDSSGLLVLSVPVHHGDHVCCYVYHHPGWILVVQLNQLRENISLWEGVAVPKVKYFSLGGYGSSAMDKASHGQINGSIEIMLGVYLGGTVLLLLVK